MARRHDWPPVRGPSLDLILGMSLSGKFGAKSQRVYLWARDNESNDTGWVQTGLWNHSGANAPPSFVGATPAAATGSPQTFTITTRDSNGLADANRVYFLVNNTASVPAGVCHGLYDRVSNAVYLFNDTLTATLGPLIPGTGTTLANSACTVHGSTTQVMSATGTDLVLNLDCRPRGDLRDNGQEPVYMGDRYAGEWHGVGTGQRVEPVNRKPVPPVLQTMTPAELTGSPRRSPLRRATRTASPI